MTDLRDYLHYFQTLANQHREINDFYICDINEPLQAMRGQMQYPALILNALAGSFQAKNLDNPIDVIKGGFLIVGNLDRPDDFEAEMLLLQKMKEIGTDIIARINHEVWQCESRAIKAVPGFDINSVKYEMFEGVFENGFGYRFDFDLVDMVDLRVDPSRWDGSKEIPGKDVY
jgi:hypothetical protein